MPSAADAPSAAGAAAPSAPTPAPPKSSGTGIRVVLGVALVLALNHLFNEAMDESGLHVAIVTGTLPPAATRSALALATFHDDVARRADAAMRDDRGLVRSEVLQHRKAEAMYSFVTVHRREIVAEEAAASARAAGVAHLSAPELYRTVFPERARWRQREHTTEDGMHAPVGFVELLTQQTVFSVSSGQVDALKHSWIDLGYNSLGEPGVVRCDLLQHASNPTTFLARKVFRGQHAVEAHESSAHFLRWHQAMLGGAVPAVLVQESILLNAVHPRTSAVPFQSAWTTF
ncbi:hypothetical protein AB1Y20_010485 [Prymnesium parvum]|uniref:ABM domain-containing protein n=1 Tax=Prymnesium parvum TaxID=97485 RepID=A0AB34IPW5_PRYPA